MARKQTATPEAKLAEYLQEAKAADLRDLDNYIKRNGAFPPKLEDKLRLGELHDPAGSLAETTRYVQENFHSRATREVEELLLKDSAGDLSRRVAACNDGSYRVDANATLTSQEACGVIRKTANDVADGIAKSPRK